MQNVFRILTFGRLRLWLLQVAGSFWLLPLLFGLVGIVLALGMLALEKNDLLVAAVLDHDWLKVVPESGRSVLTVIAGAMISATSIVYSLSLLIRTIAASNLGPRLVESFDKIRVNRTTLGLQLLTFTYSVTVLYAVRDGSAVLSVSVLAGIVIAIVALGHLVVFVNAVARQSHVDATIADIARELRRQIGGTIAGSEPGPREDDPLAGRGEAIAAPGFGYVQEIDHRAGFRAICDTDVVVAYAVRPGDFVVKGAPLLRVAGGDLDDERRARLTATVSIGPQRIDLDDPRFRLMLLVEMALRALSPGVNDVFTAVACVDNLFGVLAELGGRDLTPPAIRDDADRVRVLAKPLTFDDLIDASLHPLRQHGAAMTMLALALLRRLADLAAATPAASARDSVLRHSELIAAQATEAAAADVDRAAIAAGLVTVRRSAAGAAASPA